MHERVIDVTTRAVLVVVRASPLGNRFVWLGAVVAVFQSHPRPRLVQQVCPHLSAALVRAAVDLERVETELVPGSDISGDALRRRAVVGYGETVRKTVVQIPGESSGCEESCWVCRPAGVGKKYCRACGNSLNTSQREALSRESYPQALSCLETPSRPLRGRLCLHSECGH